ncbi:MAG TPA: hypothetical protein DHW71_01735 [Gammaproteobacteria bacterium]|nr:hypothetical protein [Gammaproteobacteria bacterium]MEC8009716.1 glycosyltransferase [Pseudomonadota bacterium]HBF09911.1 hypothetical protein [Gammaproteobacteria bacterium]HCK91674.1 hypothetical protein [Gammaproteobacteria bacterium]|tara:strand:- start:13820 stop:14950 length:1131 start_codon:yes stop_codon:yes gene_type:complete
MIKVLHSVLSLEVGGLENGVVNLINNMPDDMQVDVLCLRGKGTLIDRISHPRANIIFSGCIDDHSIKGGVKGHWDVLKNNKYDILHTHGWTTMLTGAIAAWGQRLTSFSKKPLVVNGEHGVYYDQHWRQRLMQKWLFQQMDGNLTVSADLGQRMEKAFNLPAKTFFPILNGVDTQRFKPDSSIRSSRRISLGFDENHLVIGTVGRLVEVKNYPMLIRTFHKLYQEFPHVRLVFCGDGDQRSTLEALVAELNLQGLVTFTGRINTVAETMQAFDLFALTSDMEGLPNTLLESMASGVPAVVTDVGGSREVIPHEGGYLVPARDEVALLDRLKLLVANEDKRKSVQDTAIKHIQNNLSMKSMADAYYGYYRELIKSRS